MSVLELIDSTKIIEIYSNMGFQAKNLSSAAKLYSKALSEEDTTVILTLSSSIFRAGLKDIIIDLIRNNLVDAVVASGKLLVEGDFLPFLAKIQSECNICEEKIQDIADHLEPRVYSSREFIWELGKYLHKQIDEGDRTKDSLLLSSFEKGVPIFSPVFADSSIGLNLIAHQIENPDNHISIDTIKDFREMSILQMQAKNICVVSLGGGTSRKFAKDVLSTPILKDSPPKHKYDIQITSSKTKYFTVNGGSYGEQVVLAEASIAFPLVASYGFLNNRNRKAKEWNRLFQHYYS